jgi:hypothetical protein
LKGEPGAAGFVAIFAVVLRQERSVGALQLTLAGLVRINLFYH